MNLNKFTKAELISRINKFKEDRIERRSFLNKFKSYLSSFWDFLLKLKSIIGKLTLITFFLQLFRKYSIIRRIWKILNSIIVTIFGRSLIDNFGFEVINNLLIEFKIIINNTVDYLTNTHFYMFLSKLFSNPSSEIESKSNKTGSMMEEISRKTTNGERKTSESIRQSDRNSKISEWLKAEAKNDDEIEVEISKTNYIKYFIIGGTIIIISSLGWVYWDEVKSTSQSIIEWYFSSRSDGSNNSGSNTDSSETPTRSDFQIKSRATSPDIELKDKTQLTSPSFEDLNTKVEESWKDPTSPTGSTSSLDSDKTIKSLVNPNPTQISDVWKTNPNLIEAVVDKSWKSLVNSKIKDSVEYVEKFFPKSEIEDSTYIKTLIEDVKQENVKFCQEISNKKYKLDPNQLRYSNAIAQKTELWLENIQDRLTELE